jgi:glutamyl-tRNA synthetase/glutamyl-Q tRNA(Asp) synthetase
VLTRFAPAPTGYLHLGHLVSALYVWGLARRFGAEVLLRIEDHDRQRCRPEYQTALLEDLDWLGLRPDLGATDSFRAGLSPFRQSDSVEAYEEAVETLRVAGHRVYACGCSRTRTMDEAEGGEVPAARGGSYPGTCRNRGLEPGPGRGLRVMMPEGVESFEDLRLRLQSQEPARQCGDLLIRDRLGNWTYQFAVVVDDLRQGVDLVVRGEDLLDSTGRQLLLARMLGREHPPKFFHHPLILKPSGEKLSKATRDTSLRDRRSAGATAEALMGEALAAVGLLPAPRPLGLDDAVGIVSRV